MKLEFYLGRVQKLPGCKLQSLYGLGLTLQRSHCLFKTTNSKRTLRSIIININFLVVISLVHFLRIIAVLLRMLFQVKEMTDIEVVKKTLLNEYYNKAEQKKNEDSKDARVDINDENAGCGLGTLLYTTGTFFFCCLLGSEVVMFAIVGLVLKCQWNLSSFSLAFLQLINNIAMTCSTGLSSPFGDIYLGAGKHPGPLCFGNK